MAGYGPPPAENRRRRNADRYEGHEVTVDQAGQADAPPALPGRWPAAVQRWYETWCSSPQAQAFTVTDWQRLHMLAPLVARYFKTPDKALMSEIRLNESLLGATHVDRLRARIKLAEESTPDLAPAAEDEVAKRRRQRILDAS
jgi:hypothetical protein